MTTSKIFDMIDSSKIINVIGVKSVIPPETVFKAFCDKKRLDILQLLQAGEQCACVLLEQLEMTQSGLSYHMKVLTASGIVNARQEGKWTHYSISEEGRQYASQLVLNLTEPQSVCRPYLCRAEESITSDD